MRRLSFVFLSLSTLASSRADAAGALERWASTLDAALVAHDAGETFERRATLVPATLAGTAADGDVVCSPVTRSDLTTALTTIASRQWIGRPLEPVLVEAAGRELGASFARDEAEACEWTELLEEATGPRHRQVYRFTVAPARLGRNVAIVIETRWDSY